jgi:hypothetical protein
MESATVPVYRMSTSSHTFQQLCAFAERKYYNYFVSKNILMSEKIKTLVWRNKIAQKLSDHHTVDRTRG